MWLPGTKKNEQIFKLRNKISEGKRERELGNCKASVKILKRAYRECKWCFGRSDDDTLDALSELGDTYEKMGKIDHALRLHEKVFKRRPIRIPELFIRDTKPPRDAGLLVPITRDRPL